MRFKTFEKNNLLENNDLYICEKFYDQFIDIIEKILEILKNKI